MSKGKEEMLQIKQYNPCIFLGDYVYKKINKKGDQ